MAERVELALAEARRLHALCIRMSASEVAEMFELGVGWLPAAGQREGCGTFVARCYAAAGLRADVRKYALPSTHRLDRWARGLTISGRWSPPRSAVSRFIEPDVNTTTTVGGAWRGKIVPGDIVVIRTSRGLPVGDHITLAAGLDEKTIDTYDTYEYNASGKLASGQLGRGVVTNQRPYAKVVRVYRLQPEDFET